MKEKSVCVVFVCDAWLSSDSMKLISVCENMDHVESVVRDYIEQHSMKLVDDEDNFDVIPDLLEELTNNYQTQGYNYNFNVEFTILNTLM